MTDPKGIKIMEKSQLDQMAAIQNVIYAGLEQHTKFDARNTPLQPSQQPLHDGEEKAEVALQQAIQIANQKLPVTLHVNFWAPDTSRPEMAIHTFTYFWECISHNQKMRWKYTIQNREDEKYKWIYSHGEPINE